MRIAILLNTWNSVSTRVLMGIRRTLSDKHLQWHWRVSSNSESTARLLREAYDGWLVGPGVTERPPVGQPWVLIKHRVEEASDFEALGALIDHRAVGVLAARHLHAQGYRHAAGFIYLDDPVQVEEGSAFAEQCQQLGMNCSLFDGRDRHLDQRLRNQAIQAWLHSLPHPCGIFCPFDHSAAWLQRLCADWGFAVPQRFGLIGCGDLPSACLSQSPELSSVLIPWQGLGAAAVTRLRRLLAGGDGGQTPTLRPVAVVNRASTALARNGSSLAMQAQSYVRQHLHQQLSVNDIAKYLGVSRATLSRHIQTFTGMSFHAWRNRERIDLACKMMSEEPIPLKRLAKRCGFGSYLAFYQAFRNHTGVNPSAYRDEMTE